MRASGGQTIRCGESRKKEAEVEGRSFDTDSESVSQCPRPVTNGEWSSTSCDMGGVRWAGSCFVDIGDIRCQWEVRVRGLG